MSPIRFWFVDAKSATCGALVSVALPLLNDIANSKGFTSAMSRSIVTQIRPGLAMMAWIS